MSVTEEQLQRSAFSCWAKAEEEGGTETKKRWRYHDLLVKYGHLIPAEPGEETRPRFACGWDPDPNRRVPGAI